MVEEAVKVHRRAVELAPHVPNIHSNLLRDLSHLSGLDIDEVVAEHRRWWQQHGKPVTAAIRPLRWIRAAEEHMFW